MIVRLLLLLLVLPAPAAGQDEAGSASTGERLFSGQTRFAGGGPPCAACHDIAGLPYPGGGTMGPDLTGSYAKFGPDALAVVVRTLFFPTMDPVFTGRPLTPAEQRDLTAFFARAAASPPPRPITARLLLAALVLLAAAAGLVGWLGRARLRGVRAGLVAGARRRSREGGP